MAHSFFSVPILALALWVGAPVQAVTIDSYDRDTFVDAFTGTGSFVETYDSTGPGKLKNSPGIKYTTNGEKLVVTDRFISSTGQNGIGSGANKFFEVTQKITITFLMPITAFAIDINTFATKDGKYKAKLGTGEKIFSTFDPFGTALNGQGDVIAVTTGQFIGFSSDTPFTTITLSKSSTNKSKTFTLDTLRYYEAQVATVPLPAGLPLLAASLVLLRLARRR